MASKEIPPTSEIVAEYRSLQRGDQIAVKGDIAGIDYYHHGIFLGHEEGIADFGGNDKSNATLRTVDLLEFTDKGKRDLIRINYPPGKCLPAETAAENAEKLVANPKKWKMYSAATNNCEHFATKCKTGIAKSAQAWDKIKQCLSNPKELAKHAKASSHMMSGSIPSSRPKDEKKKDAA